MSLDGRTMPVPFQDRVMMEGQGPISPRENWRMATSDRGIALFHEMLFREMEKVVTVKSLTSTCQPALQVVKYSPACLVQTYIGG